MNNTIPKYLSKRNDIFINNKYEIVKNYNSNDDFHIVIYYINQNKCKIIIRRLDDEGGWSLNLCINMYDNNNNNQNISLGSSLNNEKILYIYTNIILSPVNIINQNIPKVIIQTSKNNNYNSLLHYNSVQTFLELNPEYEYYFFKDNDCREFIKNNFDTIILDTYDMLYPGAYKADLFRYCYIYIKGGCYFDNKYILRTSLRNIIKPEFTEIYCKDTKDDLMFNAIIMAIPKLKEIKDSINNIVFNVKNNYYGTTSLEPTGPKLFNKYTHDKNVLLKHIVKGSYYTDSKVIIKENNKLFANTHYKGYYFNPNFNREKYEDLFHRREIYYKNLRKVGKYTILIYPNNVNDTFDFEIINKEYNKQLKIIRTDCDLGWGLQLKIKIINNDNHSENTIFIGNKESNRCLIDL
jgi:mannosyltransferase OCH1-like enzyme